MASLRVTIKEDVFTATADGNLGQAQKLVESACEALKAWRLCDTANP